MRCRAQLSCALLLLLSTPAAAGDVAALANRYAIGDPGGAPALPPGLTLLDPTWVLPPLEMLEMPEQTPPSPLGPRLRAPAAGGDASLARTGGPLSYSLGEGLSAQLRYRRSFLFETGRSDALRTEGPRSFSSQPVRDVLGVGMSWRLPGSTVGLGYQLESAPDQAAGGDVGLGRFLPGSEQATHSLTLGWTREWGRAPRPPLADVPFVVDGGAAVPLPTPEAGRRGRAEE